MGAPGGETTRTSAALAEIARTRVEIKIRMTEGRYDPLLELRT